MIRIYFVKHLLNYEIVLVYTWIHVKQLCVDIPRVVNLGTTTKLCLRNFVPKPHPGHVVVVSRPKIG